MRTIKAVLALAVGFAAVGCGAESGTDQNIGKATQALDVTGTIQSIADATDYNGGAVTDPVGRQYAASCKITRGGVEGILVVGGFDSTGAALDDAIWFDPGNNQWKVMEPLSTNFASETRGQAKLVKIASDKCMLVGGSTARDGGTLRPNAYIFQTDATDGSWTAAGAPAGRLNFAAFPCASDGTRVILIGGHTATGTSDPLPRNTTSIQVWNGSTGGSAAWTNQTNKLVNAISMFAAAAKDNSDFAIAGGVKSNGSYEIYVQGFTTNSDCTTVTTLSTLTDGVPDGGNLDTLRLATSTGSNSGRAGSVAYFKDSSDELYVTAGRDAAGNLPTDVQRFDITWSGSPGTAYNSHVTSLITGVRFPELVASGSGDFILLGGENNTTATLHGTAPVTSTSHLVFSSGTPAAFSGGVEALSSARIGFPAHDISGTWYVPTGLNAQTNTVLATGEKGDYTAP